MTKRKKKSSKSKQPRLTTQQTVIVASLLLIACGVWTGIGTAVYLYRDDLFSAPVAVAPLPTATPLPTVPPTATPPPTVTPAPTMTLEPTPTATYAVAPALINREKIDNITQFVEQVRGLSMPQDVPIEFLQRNQLRQQWATEAFDSTVLEAAEAQYQLHVALDLLDPQVDLVETTLDFQTRSLMGYYTPQNQTMVVIADSVNMFADEEITFAHEYMHALQDYNFGLQRLLTMGDSADALLAARALPEGDAKFVEELFTQENISQSQLDYSAYRYLLQAPTELAGVSPALGILTFFPYTAGKFFVLYLFIEGGFSWDQVNQAYLAPPISSEQIIHPEKYLAREQPIPVILPDLAPALPQGWQQLDQNTLGEIGLLVWLIDQISAEGAMQAAAGWGGDRYSLWLGPSGEQVLAHLSTWDSQAEAAEFAAASGLSMTSRHGAETVTQAAGRTDWITFDRVTRLSLRGNQVLVIIAPDSLLVEQVNRRFAGF